VIALTTRSLHVGLAFALLTYYWVTLRIRPRAVLSSAVSSTHRTRAATAPPYGSRIRQILSAVERAAQLHPLGPRCLEHALTSRALLARYGERARVVIGVHKTGDALTAHAWIEVGGYSNDASRPAFVELTHL
jgi:hypothetical protein